MGERRRIVIAGGKFESTEYKGAGEGYYRYIEVEWASTNDTANNKSTITWTAYSRGGTSTSIVYAKNIVVTINGTASTLIGNGSSKPTYNGGKLGEGTITVNHESNGRKSVPVSITAQFFNYGTPNSTYSGSITMTPNPVYNLSIDAETGSDITVNRTACAGSGSTGNMSAGTKKLYYGDKLRIAFTPSNNYQIDTHTVNGSSFTSGNTHTVSGNVSVVSTAQVIASSVRATSADIENVSTITVTKHSTSYYHSLQYKFGNLSGYITSSGGTSTTEIKFSEPRVDFKVPTAFYAQIPNARSGICEITCRTYSSNSSTTVLGAAKTCTFIVTASSTKCAPAIIGYAMDTNPTTTALTGNNLLLIRYKSTVKCGITAVAKNQASISSRCINNVSTETGTRTFYNVSGKSFVLSATDSRGYTSIETMERKMIDYVQLTCNPTIVRPSPTGSSIEMTFTGDIFQGSLGKCKNTLTLKYRYKVSNGSYGLWQTVASENIKFGASTYCSESAISVGNEFDYNKDYVFQVEATDGGTVDGTAYTLSTVTKEIAVSRGIPVFDWGAHDFTFNVPVNIRIDPEDNVTWGSYDDIPISINNTNIIDILYQKIIDKLYPEGSVYLSTSDTPPDFLQNRWGAWSCVDMGNDIKAFSELV